jgi:hypothetical protein
MEYPQYRRDLNKVYYSEVFGETLFDTAARWARVADQRMKWLKLKELETQTRERLMAFLQASGQQTRQPALAKLHGQISGKLLGLLPWPVSMRLLEHGTASFLKVFERLEQHAGNETRAFFSYVVAHERAIAEFASRERKGQKGNSLLPVTKLLQGQY